MASARFAWGIDIGNRALKAVKLVREGDRLRIDDFEVIEHEQVLSTAGDNRQALIQTALANFVQRHQVKGGVVGIGVSGQSSFARFIKLPPVEPRKIPEIVRFEAIQQIPFPLEDVEWSYQLFQDPESPDIEVGIFAMRKELVAQHVGNFTDIDLNVQLVQMNPLAVYNAMYYDNRIRGTTMIVDLGAENTDLIIAEGETVWLRSIPIGGNNFTEALVKAFKLSFQKAEELKRNAKTSKYARQIFQAMRPVFADLVAEIQRSIGFYASVHRDARIQRVLGLGGTFRLPGLQKYLQQNLQLEVQHISGFGAGAPDDGKLATTFNENLLALPAAYGLALQVMGEGKIQSSLLPESIRRAKMWQDKTKWFGAAAALFVLGTGIAYGSLVLSDVARKTPEATANATKVKAILSKAQGLSTQWSDVESRGSADRQRILNVESLTNYRNLWPNLIVDLYKALPQPPPVGDVAAIKATPRGERKVILIDTLAPRYVSDMTQVLAASDGEFKKLGGQGTLPTGGQPMGGGNPYGGGYPPGYGDDLDGPMSSGGQPGATENANAPHGYLLTITCITPNTQGVNLVDSQFLAKLNEMTAARMYGQHPYYIARTSIISAMHIRDDQQRLSAMQNAYQAAVRGEPGASAPTGGGYGRGGGVYDMRDEMPASPMYPGQGGGYPRGGYAAQGAPAAGQPDADAPFLDRLTGEDVRNDRIVTVLVAVVLDPPAPQPAGNDNATGQ